MVSKHNTELKTILLQGLSEPKFFDDLVYKFRKNKTKTTNKRFLFVCVDVLRPSQTNGFMSSAVSLPNHTFTGQAWSSKRLTSTVYILLPETDNCHLESAEGRE